MATPVYALDEDPRAGGAVPSARERRQVRCLVVQNGGSQSLAELAALCPHTLSVAEAVDVSSARAELAGGSVDLVLLDPDDMGGEAPGLVGEITSDIGLAAIPVIVVSRDASAGAIVRAVQAGATEYLVKDGLDVNALDRAIGATIDESGLARRDGQRRIAELAHEVATLRRLSARNMRLLKSQSLPLLAFAWKMVAGGRVGEREQPGMARRLARLTRGLTSLIDETTILANTRHGEEAAVPVNLGHVIDDLLASDTGEIRASSAHVSVASMPTLMGRRSHLVLLMRELLVNAVRSARFGVVPEITIRSGHDRDGLPVITLTENGIPLSQRKQILSRQAADLVDRSETSGADPHIWSLCQRLAEKNRGEFRIADDGDAGCKVMVRFARDMLVETD